MLRYSYYGGVDLRVSFVLLRREEDDTGHADPSDKFSI